MSERGGGDELPAPLWAALATVAATPQLLVGCDYDGTLAPIVPEPSEAFALPEAIAALGRLAELDSTTVVVISGRALQDLTVLADLPPDVHMVGSHGAEFDAEFAQEIPPAATAMREALVDELNRLIEGAAGVTLEIKPASIAVHVRRADQRVGAEVLAAVRSGPASWEGVQVTEGKAVIELAVVQTDKGHAFDVLRHQVGATAAMFVGDDVTDEKVFARLRPADLGVKVGDGESLAEYRLADTADVAVMLDLLAGARRDWLLSG